MSLPLLGRWFGRLHAHSHSPFRWSVSGFNRKGLFMIFFKLIQLILSELHWGTISWTVHPSGICTRQRKRGASATRRVVTRGPVQWGTWNTWSGFEESSISVTFSMEGHPTSSCQQQCRSGFGWQRPVLDICVSSGYVTWWIHSDARWGSPTFAFCSYSPAISLSVHLPSRSEYVFAGACKISWFSTRKS